MIGRAYRALIASGAGVLARAGARPNQITVAALVVGIGACGAFLWTRDAVLFAVLMLAGGYLDTLDGAVARLTDTGTAFGAYLDAIADRIFDSAALLAIAFVSGQWALCMTMGLGGFMVSYTKARAGMEAPISNLGWPHIMGREERVIGLASTLLLWGFFPAFELGGFNLLAIGLALMTALLLVTAAMRIAYAYRLLSKAA